MPYSSSFVLIISNVHLIVWLLGSGIPTIILVKCGVNLTHHFHVPRVHFVHSFNVSVEFYTNPYLIYLCYFGVFYRLRTFNMT